MGEDNPIGEWGEGGKRLEHALHSDQITIWVRCFVTLSFQLIKALRSTGGRVVT